MKLLDLVILSLCLIMGFAGCRSTNISGSHPLNPSPTQNDEELKLLAQNFQKRSLHSLGASSTTTPSPTNRLTITDMDNSGIYIQAGLSLANRYCDEFFTKLAIAQAKLNFLQSDTASFGGLVSTIMGLAQAGSAATGGVGALFGFSNAVFDNYNSAFLIAPNIAAAHDLVRRAQQKAEIEILKSNPTTLTFFAAERLLNDYVQLCNVNGIKRLVSEATSRCQPEVASPNSGSDPIQLSMSCTPSR